MDGAAAAQPQPCDGLSLDFFVRAQTLIFEQKRVLWAL
jgi:hypothetical protein